MRKICFILSSVGGPRLLSSIFSHSCRKDITYLIFQYMPNEEFISALIQCLQSEISNEIKYVNEDMSITPGNIYFLSNQHSYIIESNRIIYDDADKKTVRHPVDHLLFSAVESGNMCNVVVLSGMLLEQDGIQGITRLKESGAKVYTLPKKDIPIKNMADDLESLNLIDEVYTQRAILANLDFSSDSPPEPSEKQWLIVDDEEDIRNVIGTILSMEGIESDTAVDGLDALRKIQKTRYAAMILDIKMPELDGLQTLQALQTIDPDIPILIVTGFEDEETKRAGDNTNVKGTLLKPFTSADLRYLLPEMKRVK